MDVSRIRKEDKQKYYNILSHMLGGELNPSELESLKNFFSYNENIIRSILKFTIKQRKRIYTQLYEVWIFIPTIHRNSYKNISKANFKDFRGTELGKEVLSFFTTIEQMRNLSNYEGFFEVGEAVSTISENLIEIPHYFVSNFATFIQTILLQAIHIYGKMYNLMVYLERKGYAELFNPNDEQEKYDVEIFLEFEGEVKKLDSLLFIDCDRWENLYLILNNKVLKSQIINKNIICEVCYSSLPETSKELPKLKYSKRTVLPCDFTKNAVVLSSGSSQQIVIQMVRKEEIKGIENSSIKILNYDRDKQKSIIHNRIEDYLKEALLIFESIGKNNKQEDEVINDILAFLKKCYLPQLSNRGFLMITGCIAAQIGIFDTEETYDTNKRSTYSNYLYNSVVNRQKRLKNN